MKKLLLAALLGAFAIAAAVWAQDPHTVGPKIYSKKLENDRCRVYEITFKPGASIGMHSHPDHAVYVVTAGTLEIREPNKKPVVLKAKPGDTFFLPAQSHSAKNVGKTTLKAVVVEIR